MFRLKVTIIRQTFQYLDMFSAYSMGSYIVYICCVEIQAYKFIKHSIIRYLE